MAAFSELVASLSAVTPPASPGETGTVLDLGFIQDGFVLYMANTATSSDVAYVNFSGSVDGTAWYGLISEATEIIGGHGIAQITEAPARYVQASAYTSAGSPVVTASVAGIIC
jgi:hypothetical protein